jgi:O-phosphoseryl-tRNA(Cys) synthetase
VIDDVPYEFSQVKTQDSIQTISKKMGFGWFLPVLP